MGKNFFVGKTITGIKIARDREAMLISTTDGQHNIVRVDGDCCSHSWIESVELPALGFPALVTAVDDLDLSQHNDDHSDEFECLQVYGVKISTDRGEIVIDFRNSSNGYYGGNIVWPYSDYFYGGVFGQNISDNDWVSL
jgi:hypothetical protein